MSNGLKHPSIYLLHIPHLTFWFRHIRTPHMLEKLDKSEYVHEEVDTNKEGQNERSDEDYDNEDEE